MVVGKEHPQSEFEFAGPQQEIGQLPTEPGFVDVGYAPLGFLQPGSVGPPGRAAPGSELLAAVRGWGSAEMESEWRGCGLWCLALDLHLDLDGLLSRLVNGELWGKLLS